MNKKNVLHPSMIDSSITLEALGIDELAWRFEDVHHVIDYLVDNGYAILGGDVYSLLGNEINSTYDGWYLDRDVIVTWNNYMVQSKVFAHEYINSYHTKNGEHYCYSLVYSKERSDSKE